ncbi:MAG: response regulator transcription factor [Alphaproteobacteria bacterium]|nr:response regulator transcription factor [Alphaproteobacteria bacterium]MDE2112242.1 response regulator transcription factor [Alphaproteobacteria bacterium]MDE2494174.1 response regulator transcription factor [Alphaproteobacteria bacterium]
MRCLVIGKQVSPLGRLSQYLKERGWQLHNVSSPASLKADGQAAIAADLTIMECGEDDNALKANIVAVRNASRNTIILVVGDFSTSARTHALSHGASEFVPHDIPLRLFQARITALLRLRSDLSDLLYKTGSLIVDVLHRRVYDDHHELHLSHMEFQLLVALVQNCGKTLSRSEIIEKLWGNGGRTEDNTLENHVSRLRGKLPRPTGQRIVTVRGVGYRFEAS